jgi:8-oxo-dGTP diphosphatase
MSARHTVIVDVHLLLIHADGRLCFLRRHNTGWEDGSFHLPAGHLEADEDVTAAIVREAAEELGVIVDPCDLRLVHVMHRRTSPDRVGFFFEARRWQGEARNAEPSKCSEVGWFSADALPSPLVGYAAQAIEAWRGRGILSTWGW